MFAAWYLSQSEPVADVDLCPCTKLGVAADQSANGVRRAMAMIDCNLGAPVAPIRDGTRPGIVDATVRENE